ncbi:myo-inositol-1(or 4)-monophosphatase [Poseidonocella pacifica]|uniref:Myo-inositol-1(Or 4)-monophosphatase n=1 Tax=Poseidonocella pacifica TaxID=871651 RepID=A0A1I0WMJ1_9RHOB|nr:3'(2'),5'-bisphosphate nucleotidase CysQ [Poseidonocella pacifica]SFA89213.1 myo-inositol-1(or 4)-monophosphatase [Poseidonocella pacifica]
MTDLELLTEAAREAGRIATMHFGGALDVVEKPGGAGPVTAADHAVNFALQEILCSARPHYGWLSEESPEDPTRRAAPRTFIVDPIDGTRSFIAGQKTWGHALAVVENGQVIAAAVYMPLRDELFASAVGEGATKNDLPIKVSRREGLEGAEVLATRPNLSPDFWPGGVPRMNAQSRPSLAYRLCAVAEGRFDATFTFRPAWEWDIAAGTLILTEAGAQVTDREGRALIFNNPAAQVNGLIAGPPRLHAALQAASAPRPLP